MSTKTKIAVYAGSFAPYHIGHQNIVQKAKAIFGDNHVIVAVGCNPDKGSSGRENFRKITGEIVEFYGGLLTDYITELEQRGYDVTLVRGLRNGYDLQYESNQLQFLKDMKKDIKVIFIMCDKEFEHISSSAIRSLQKINPDAPNPYLPKEECRCNYDAERDIMALLIDKIKRDLDREIIREVLTGRKKHEFQ